MFSARIINGKYRARILPVTSYYLALRFGSLRFVVLYIVRRSSFKCLEGENSLLAPSAAS